MIAEPLFATAGHFLIHLIFGGGIGGAFLILIVSKLTRKVSRVSLP